MIVTCTYGMCGYETEREPVLTVLWPGSVRSGIDASNNWEVTAQYLYVVAYRLVPPRESKILSHDVAVPPTYQGSARISHEAESTGKHIGSLTPERDD